MKRTLLDQAISALSPAWGLRRERARSALDILHKRSYDGAKTGRRTGGWTTGSTSADSEIAPALNKLRDRSRDLVRNNPYGARAASIFCSNIVGTGLIAKVPKAQDVWDTWCRQCDADGMIDFYGIQALVVRTLFEAGECLIRYRVRRPEDGMAVPLSLQVLEPDFLDSAKTGATSGGGYIRDGIEYNGIGQRVAYYIFNQHPGDNGKGGKALSTSRVPAEDVLHIFERHRPGQNRGVPRLASAMLRMRDLDDYEEAELVRKGIESCFAAFVTTEEDGQTLGAASVAESGVRVESMAAGMVQYLKPGQDITFGAPQSSGDYGAYTRTQLRAIAAGVGLTYEQLTGDLSGVNYSSIRAGMVEFHRTVDALQWLTLVPMMLDPIYRRWAVMAKSLRAVAEDTPETVRWTPPRRQWVDPLKDVNAARNEISAGITSLSETIRGRGEDPEKVFAEIAEERARMDELGIVSDLIAAPIVEAPPDPDAALEKTARIELLRAQTSREEATREAATRQMPPALADALQRLQEVEAQCRALAGREPASIHITNTQPPAPAPAEIRIDNHLPAQAAPVVEVRNEIHEREQAAPIINVAAPNVEVTVEANMPAQSDIRILEMPDRVTTSSIERDGKGSIVQTTQTEKDA